MKYAEIIARAEQDLAELDGWTKKMLLRRMGIEMTAAHARRPKAKIVAECRHFLETVRDDARWAEQDLLR